MKKIFFYSVLSLLVIFNVFASDNEQIKELTENIKNAPSGGITVTNIPTDDDCVHTLINKDGIPILYERACFSIGLRLQGFDPVEFADYTFTIYNDDGTETKITGEYKHFKELIDIISEVTQTIPIQIEPQESVLSQ